MMRLFDADKVIEEIQRDIDYPVKNENERCFRMALRYARNLIEQYSFTEETIPISFIEGLIEGGQILNDLGKLDSKGKAYLSALKSLVERWQNEQVD